MRGYYTSVSLKLIHFRRRSENGKSKNITRLSVTITRDELREKSVSLIEEKDYKELFSKQPILLPLALAIMQSIEKKLFEEE